MRDGLASAPPRSEAGAPPQGRARFALSPLKAAPGFVDAPSLVSPR